MIKNNVLIGKKNWLFLYNGEQRQFDYLLGEKEVDSESIINFISNIKERKEYCKKNSIKYKHVIFPSKPVIKQSYIPDAFSKIESLYLKSYSKNIENLDDIFYPIEELKTIDYQYSTFHKYNTHNSDIGYLEIINKLLDSISIESIPLEKFSLVEKEVGGDLMNMIKDSMKHKEQFLNYQGSFHYSIGNRTFLPGNTNDVQIMHNPGALSNKRLLIFGDSFFKDILFIRSTFFHQDVVESFVPDVIFTGNAERYLSHVESDKEAGDFLLELYGNYHYKPSVEYIESLKAQLSFRYYKHIYKKWSENIKKIQSSKRIKLENDFENPDILREVAIYFENQGQIELAYQITKEALSLRPNGLYIKKLHEKYKNYLIKWGTLCTY